MLKCQFAAVNSQSLNPLLMIGEIQCKKGKREGCVPGVWSRRGGVCHWDHARVCRHLQTGPVIVAGQHGQASWGILRVTNCNTDRDV